MGPARAIEGMMSGPSVRLLGQRRCAHLLAALLKMEAIARPSKGEAGVGAEQQAEEHPVVGSPIGPEFGSIPDKALKILEDFPASRPWKAGPGRDGRVGKLVCARAAIVKPIEVG